jgi:hypothetical protein
MKKLFYLILFPTLGLFNNPIFAQDLIQTSTGETITSRVLEISDTEVKYKNFSNPTGPTYIKNKKEIKSVTYENGLIEEFKNTSKAEQSAEKNIVHPPLNDGNAIAKVKRINGIDIYFLSNPLVNYTTVFNSGDLLSDIDIKALFWEGMATSDVDDKMNRIVNATYRKAKREGKTVTGLIYTGGNRALAINYTDTDIKGEQFAKVNIVNGVQIYVFSEPTKTYDILTKARAKSGGFLSVMSDGVLNSNMDDDINNLIERLNSKKNPIDAIIYNSGKKGVGIKLN